MFERTKHWLFLKLFDAQALVKLQCGEISGEKIHYNIPEREIEDCGIC